MFLHSLLICSVVVFIFVSIYYLISLVTHKNSVADIAWGMGFPLIAYTCLVINGLGSPTQLLVSLLVLLWGVRLSTHIYSRNRGKGEDFRYAEWKKQWGKQWKLKSYLQVFLLQGILMLLVAFPVIFTNTYSASTLSVFVRMGTLLWIIGFYFEALGDWQLMRFKNIPLNKGKVMKTGLWKYTRHPNYFGEACMWWGIYVITLSNLSGWWTFVGPLFITFSLLKVSGVTLLEKKYNGNREYQEYQKSTSSFIPWFPQKS